jgi:hypothetical protein
VIRDPLVVKALGKFDLSITLNLAHAPDGRPEPFSRAGLATGAADALELCLSMSSEFQQLVAIGMKAGLFAGIIAGVLAGLWARGRR